MKKPDYNTLALGSIKSRKKQYAILLVGIFLASVFSSGTLFMLSSIRAGEKELRARATGNEDAVFFNLTDEELSEGVSGGYITDYAEGKNLGLIYTDSEIKGVPVASLTQKAREMTHVFVLEGAYPENAGEIALEQDVLTRLRIDAAPGDTIKVNLKPQSGADYLDMSVEKEYLLTGILHNKRSLIEAYLGQPGLLPAAYVSEKEEAEENSFPGTAVFAVMEKKDKNNTAFFDYIRVISAEAASAGILITDVYLPGVNDLMDTGILLSVLCAVLMLISCVAVVNAFSSVFADKKRQTGLLRAIGATRRQITKAYAREALVLALAAVIPAVAVSFLLTKLVISLFGGDMLFIPDFPLLVLSGAVSVIAVFFAALIPCRGAAKTSPMQALRDTDRIRAVRKTKIKNRQVFSPAVLYAKRGISFGRGRIFAVSIILALCVILSSLGISLTLSEYKNVPRYEWDYRISVARQFAGFSNWKRNGFSGLSDGDVNEILLNPYVAGVEYDGETAAVVQNDSDSEFLRVLSLTQSPSVTLSNVYTEISPTAEEYVSLVQQYREGDNEKEQVMNAVGTQNDVARVTLRYADTSAVTGLKNEVREGKIDSEKIASGEEVVMALPENGIGFIVQEQIFDGEGLFLFPYEAKVDENGEAVPQKGATEVQKTVCTAPSDLHVGDTVHLYVINEYYDDSDGVAYTQRYKNAEIYEFTSVIGAIVSPGDWNDTYLYAGDIITSNSALTAKGMNDDYSSVTVKLKSECTDEINESVMKTLETVTAGMDCFVSSNYEIKKQDEKDLRTFTTGLISVILLMLTVSCSIINNTVTARIRQDKRSVGTLRAVGAPFAVLRKAYTVQLLYMTGIGTASGLGLYALIIAGVKIFEIISGESLMIHLYILPPLILCAAVFAVCSLNLFFRLKKLTKTSIVDNIREL